MKLNKLSLSLAITLAIGSTFGAINYAHAATTNTTETTSAVANAVDTAESKVQATTTKAKAETTAAKSKADATTNKVKAHAATAKTKADSATSKAKSTATTAKKDAKSTERTVKADAKATKVDTKTTAKETTTKTAVKTEKPKENLPVGVYTDTKDNWARNAIQVMTQAGYLSGYADDTFRPGQVITREQAAAIYSNVLQKELSEQELAEAITKETAISYSDVESDRWSNSAIKLAGATGAMEGTSKTAFNPSKSMNREEFVAATANLVKKIKPDAAIKTEKVTFKDEASISSEYKKDIEYMAQRGYVASGATTDFNPTQAVTRAQAATILNRILGDGIASKATTSTNAKPVATKKDSTKETAKTDTKEKAKAVADTKATEEKVDTSSRFVRPASKTVTVKPLTQKQQESLENNVFTELNKTYKTPEAFQDYGVMYWRDNQLHVALKNVSDMDTVKANLASRNNSTVNDYVVVEPSRYSQTEYDVIENNFRNYYAKNEKAGNIITTFPDVKNNQLYAVVSTASYETQQGISKVFGSKVKMIVKR